MLEHVQTQQEEADATYYKERDQGEISEDTRKAMGCYRITTTTRGLCNELFYDQIIRLGNIHNGSIGLNEIVKRFVLKSMIVLQPTKTNTTMQQ